MELVRNLNGAETLTLKYTFTIPATALFVISLCIYASISIYTLSTTHTPILSVKYAKLNMHSYFDFLHLFHSF